MSARRRRSTRLRKLHNNRNKNNHQNHNHHEDEDIDLPSSTTNNSPQSTSITTNNLPPNSPNPDTNHNHNHHSLSSSQHEQSLPDNNPGQETPENSEEKELSTSSSSTSTTSTSQQLSYCRGLSRTPLSVPMVAEVNTQSVTRNDAKAITETRLKRLKELSQRPEQTLSKDQKDEKKRIIRLEKNRRAAAMSRRKKKMYVKNLEEKTHLMARHLAILEMENSHLRALLQAAQQTNIQSPAAMVGLPAFKLPNLPQFQLPSLTQFNRNRNNSEVINHSLSVTATTATTATSNTSKNESVDVGSSSNEPLLKKRRLNDGSSVNENISNSLSPSCDHENSSDIDILEPLPLPIQSNNNKGNEMVLPPPPPPPAGAVAVGFMGGHHLLPPNMANIHPSRLMPPHYVGNHGNGNRKRQRLRATDVLPKIDKMDKIEAIVIDKDDEDDGNSKQKENGKLVRDEIKRNEEEGKSMEEMENHGNTQNIPPPVVIHRLSNEFMTLLDDDDIMNQAVNECDGVLQFDGDIKTDNVASYL